jgi:hypothetical protein
MHDANESELLAAAAEKAARLIAGLERESADLSAAAGVAEKAQGETALLAATAAARRVLLELENIRD